MTKIQQYNELCERVRKFSWITHAKTTHGEQLICVGYGDLDTPLIEQFDDIDMQYYAAQPMNGIIEYTHSWQGTMKDHLYFITQSEWKRIHDEIEGTIRYKSPVFGVCISPNVTITNKTLG